jgi:hypothetical protein
MSTYGFGAATQRRIVELLRADGALCSDANGLLFPDYAPRIDETDVRVYESSVQFPTSHALVYALPRLLIEVVERAHDYEQEDPHVLQGPVRVWVHTVTAKEDSERAERIDAYVTTLLLSTWLSDASIIAARLSRDGDRRRGRIEAFNGAWEIVTGFSAPNVGSLA